jgi:hypothetical protein
MQFASHQATGRKATCERPFAFYSQTAYLASMTHTFPASTAILLSLLPAIAFAAPADKRHYLGVATDSSQVTISHLTTTCQFMVPKEQSAELQTMFRATGTAAGITTSAIPGFSAAVTTAAVLARAGLGRPSGRCGIAGNSGRLWIPKPGTPDRAT